jgi:hypothetical protein
LLTKVERIPFEAGVAAIVTALVFVAYGAGTWGLGKDSGFDFFLSIPREGVSWIAARTARLVADERGTLLELGMPEWFGGFLVDEGMTAASCS